MKYVMLFILFVSINSTGYAEEIAPLSQNDKPQGLDGKAMLCACIEADAEEKYYGFLFYNGKIKKLSIYEESLHVPDDAEGNLYSLVNVLSAKKIFWRGISGVNSLDRRNLLHLLDGKQYGWCKAYTQSIVTEILLEKIQEKKFGPISRSIADDLR